MRAVDTNVLVRLIVRDDVRQVASARKFIERGAWVPTLAVAEAAWVLETVYGRDARGVAEAIGMLLDLDNLVVQNSDAVAAALARFDARPGLGLANCLMLELARKAGHLPLGTFDRDLGKVEGAQKL
jgi:predicted nucleic acid-binding protein